MSKILGEDSKNDKVDALQVILDDSENFFSEDVDVDEGQLTKKQKGGQTLTQT